LRQTGCYANDVICDASRNSTRNEASFRFAETTIDAIAANPKDREHLKQAGFDRRT
jgi:hypothetical protein